MIITRQFHPRQYPSPLVGEARRGGTANVCVVIPPTPNPSPQGGGERAVER